MSSKPASAITSASPSFWQVIPTAPASSWSRASSGSLWVLMCGRSATPCSSQYACIRETFRSIASRSAVRTGVSSSETLHQWLAGAERAPFRIAAVARAACAEIHSSSVSDRGATRPTSSLPRAITVAPASRYA